MIFSVKLHNLANFITQNSFQSIQIVAGYEKLHSQPIFKHFWHTRTLSQELVYAAVVVCTT